MLPKINQTLYIQIIPEIVNKEADTPPLTLRSRVADLDDKNIYIEIPLDEKSRKLYRSELGEKFQLFFFTQEGVKHLFASSVTGFRKDSVPLVSIRKPELEEITKDQRRSFLRVEANLELAVKIGDKLRFVAITEDVGGGGISFTCERKWPIVPNAVLSCWLLLSYKGGSVAHARFEGEVVRVLPVEPDKHLIMMRFQEIADSDQQKIIRYCFERQLDKRKE
ncbi:flagellar brake protein [Cohnella silvisoli]|uniref:Flagellar brake domain-containing protein n=1 Tax=Cohnella silvisoli TaxID=2873699 RepID=A0ABV1KSA1_9BACL|nr:flagellar brake domain-containing protein [Cohnella silvisoli]MCD9021232.1 flagellar brake domain-containing protein [Cohnella silvisoli]